MKKWVLLIVSLIALSLLVVPAAAQTVRTEYQGVEYCGPVVGGREWVSEDGVLHGRGGQIECLDVVDDDRISGDL